MSNALSAAALDSVAPIPLAARAVLADAVARVSKVVDKRATIPVLGNVRMTGDGGALRVTGTDLDVWHVVTVPGVAADSRFDMTAPAHVLAKILSGETSEYAEMRASKGRLGLDFEGPSTALDTLPADDFPNVTPGAELYAFTMPAAELRDALTATLPATSTEETRYYLNGVFMHATTAHGRPVLRFAATDGHRLARFTADRPEGVGDDAPAFIIPRKTVGLVLRELTRKPVKEGKGKAARVVVEGAPETVSVTVYGATVHDVVTARHVAFDFGGSRIVSKLIDGTFPDYGRVIPNPAYHDKAAALDCGALREAVANVSAVASDRGRAVRLEIVEAGGAALIDVSTNNPDMGRSNRVIDVPSYEGGGLCIGFNSSYLRDVLDTLGTGGLTIRLQDPGSPTVFHRTDDADGARLLCVIMPMRV